jgi:hypothetical protein
MKLNKDNREGENKAGINIKEVKSIFKFHNRMMKKAFKNLKAGKEKISKKRNLIETGTLKLNSNYPSNLNTTLQERKKTFNQCIGDNTGHHAIKHTLHNRDKDKGYQSKSIDVN